MAGIIGSDVEMLRQCGRRVGVLGGTFDPIHNGHLRLADYVLNVFELDSVLFVPAARPPHKGQATVTSFAHRSAMVKLALTEPRFFMSEMEAYRQGPSYSVDTLKELRNYLPPEIALFFIVGMDAFVEITTWKNCNQLLDYADLVVVARPAHPLELVRQVSDSLGRYSFDSARSCWISSDHIGRIYPADMPHIGISSTAIRASIESGIPPGDLLPATVAEYIVKHRLFAGR